jgi:hypothetical protein
MTGRWFKLSLPDAVLRTMSRAEYYSARSAMRKMERELVASPEFKKAEQEAHQRLINLLAFGTSHPEVHR